MSKLCYLADTALALPPHAYIHPGASITSTPIYNSQYMRWTPCIWWSVFDVNGFTIGSLSSRGISTSSDSSFPYPMLKASSDGQCRPTNRNVLQDKTRTQQNSNIVDACTFGWVRGVQYKPRNNQLRNTLKNAQLSTHHSVLRGL